MLDVVVRVDKKREPATIVLRGWLDEFPRFRRTLVLNVIKGPHRIQIDLGQVFNMTWHGDILLVQTDLLVAEVVINRGEGNQSGEHKPKPTLRLIKGELC